MVVTMTDYVSNYIFNKKNPLSNYLISWPLLCVNKGSIFDRQKHREQDFDNHIIEQKVEVRICRSMMVSKKQ